MRATDGWPDDPAVACSQVRSIVDSVLRADELDECEVLWLPPDEQPGPDLYRTNFPARLRADGPPHLWIGIVACDEQWSFGTWYATGGMTWYEFLARFADELTFWTSETDFAWGELRAAALPDDQHDQV